MRKKSLHQLQALEGIYSENMYPTHGELESYAEALGLTIKEVRGWFVEKRRRDRSKRFNKKQDPVSRDRSETNNTTSSSRFNYASSVIRSSGRKRKKFQDMLSPHYILMKIFRKDGPLLGAEFDPVPSKGFCQRQAFRLSPQPACQGVERATKKRKVPELAIQDPQQCVEKTAPAKKHGMGKGLMTVWQAVHPNGGRGPPAFDLPRERVFALPQRAIANSQKRLSQKKKPRQLAAILKQKRMEKRFREKNSSISGVMRLNKDGGHKQPRKEKCELALDISKDHTSQLVMLVDDEELEMRELQAGPKPLTCSDHISIGGFHGCSLCKDLLPRFPPNSVKMKLPFAIQPWDSSPECVRKLFKVFHFLYTYSIALGICPFTLDEFTKAFHDKDSMLLGRLHISLLKLLLHDVEKELSREVFPHFSVSCKFLLLLHSLESRAFLLDLWKSSLNGLTWIEILRQILVAAGFGSNISTVQSEAQNKEKNLMARYGLRPGTLKGELFRLLSEQGNNGLKVCDIANSPQVAELNPTSRTGELEQLIYSTLSSDITLFEKISSSTYRLRINPQAKEPDEFQSDSEDSGSVEDYPSGDCMRSCNDECEWVPENCSPNRLRIRKAKHKSDMLRDGTEIDESNHAEPWLSGLMEGEYTDMSIEEKLDVLVALVDLLCAGSTIRMEDQSVTERQHLPSINHGSGAKIKRSLPNQPTFPQPSWVHAGQTLGCNTNNSLDSCPIDSLSILRFCGWPETRSGGENANGAESEANILHPHPMESVYLGSDRRYNRYWLFLGPCCPDDPGHKRVYFESSEDGHWQVIDTEEAFRSLLSVLDDRGAREALLVEALEKREAFLCGAMSNRMSNDATITHLTHSDTSQLLDIITEDSSSPVSDLDNNFGMSDIANDYLTPEGAVVFEVGRNKEHLQEWNRLQEFDAWIWTSFYRNLNSVKRSERSYLDSLARCETCHDLYWRDEKHCKICHTTFELDFDLEERYAIHAATCKRTGNSYTYPKHKVLPSKLQALKAAVHAIESAMPDGALVGAWTKSAHRLWVKRLRRTSTLSELLQVISDFVGAINEDWFWQCNGDEVTASVIEEIITCFPTMVQTSSAIALWLVKLDALVGLHLEKAQHEANQEQRPKSTGTP